MRTHRLPLLPDCPTAVVATCPTIGIGRRAAALAMTWALCVAACASAPPTTTTNAQEAEVAQSAGGMIEHILRPQKLDPAADKYQDPQYAYRAGDATTLRKPLVVYLVGANAKPFGSRPMLQMLARFGFRVLCPMYATDYNISKVCQAPDEPDDDCHKKARLEAFEGGDQSPHLDISRANSAEERVARLLKQLGTQDPEGGWASYLDGDKPRWADIIIAGHSHGASTAGLVGKVRRVNRVVMLSGPYDSRGGNPAPWIAMPSLTSADRFFGFSHAKEEQNAGHLKAWQTLKLGTMGAPVTVDGGEAPFGGSHQLLTALPPDGTSSPHGTTTAGKATPNNADGSYKLEPVWRYLFGI